MKVNRSRLFYKSVGEKPENLKIIQIMDKHLTKRPTEGFMPVVYFLIACNFPEGPKRIRRLLKVMDRQTFYQRR